MNFYTLYKCQNNVVGLKCTFSDASSQENKARFINSCKILFTDAKEFMFKILNSAAIKSEIKLYDNF